MNKSWHSNPDMPASNLSVRDLVSEATSALVDRPARAVLTIAGVILGIGTFVAVVALSDTAAGQISGRFDALTATTVTATDARSTADEALPIPSDADTRIAALNGVTAAGVVWTVDAGSATTRTTPDPRTSQSVQIPVVSASAGLWDAVVPHMVQGRTFDAFADLNAQRVVVLSASAARTLGITTVATQPAIFIGDSSFVVVGVFDDTIREPDLLVAMVVPRGAATRMWGSPTPKEQATVVVATNPGAAPQVSAELPYALSPDRPVAIRVTPPPDPRSLRDAVTNDLSSLLYSLAALSLLIGAAGIANTTLVAVLERTPEIGLRRALGARPRHIGAQIVTESSVLGGLGGLIGTSLGILVALGVCVWKQWTPILDTRAVLLAVALGVLTGGIAGLYPAARASRIEPNTALRR